MMATSPNPHLVYRSLKRDLLRLELALITFKLRRLLQSRPVRENPTGPEHSHGA
jgi:hypothetical protein